MGLGWQGFVNRAVQDTGIVLRAMTGEHAAREVIKQAPLSQFSMKTVEDPMQKAGLALSTIALVSGSTLGYAAPAHAFPWSSNVAPTIDSTLTPPVALPSILNGAMNTRIPIDESSLLSKLLEQQQGLHLGIGHYELGWRQHLIDNMPNLAKEGVTKIFDENPGFSVTEPLKRYLENGDDTSFNIYKDALKKFFQENTSSIGLELSEPTLNKLAIQQADLAKKAKELNIDYIALPSPSELTEEQLEHYVSNQNKTWAALIQDKMSGSNPEEKYLVITGALHASQYGDIDTSPMRHSYAKHWINENQDIGKHMEQEVLKYRGPDIDGKLGIPSITMNPLSHWRLRESPEPSVSELNLPYEVIGRDPTLVQDTDFNSKMDRTKNFGSPLEVRYPQVILNELS